MLDKCVNCDRRILVGGTWFFDWRFCDDDCASKFRAKLVDEFVPKEVVDEHVMRVFDGPCPVCRKPARNDIYSATRISAFLVMFKINTERKICCPPCARKNRLMAALHCGVAGWWGPKAAICNLFILPTNLVAALLVRNPSEPSATLTTTIKSALAESMAPQILAALQQASQTSPAPGETG